VPPTINPTPPIVISAQAAPVAPPAPRSPEVILTTTPVGARPVMPDVQGLAARDAVRILGSVGLTVRLSGSGFGFVVSQKPAAGQAVDPGEVSVIELRRMGAPVPRAPGGRE